MNTELGKWSVFFFLSQLLVKVASRLYCDHVECIMCVYVHDYITTFCVDIVQRAMYPNVHNVHNI